MNKVVFKRNHAPTVSEIVKDSLTQLALENWPSGSIAKVNIILYLLIAKF